MNGADLVANWINEQGLKKIFTVTNLIKSQNESKTVNGRKRSNWEGEDQKQ